MRYEPYADRISPPSASVGDALRKKTQAASRLAQSAYTPLGGRVKGADPTGGIEIITGVWRLWESYHPRLERDVYQSTEPSSIVATVTMDVVMVAAAWHSALLPDQKEDVGRD
jgi:hypothetical protein